MKMGMKWPLFHQSRADKVVLTEIVPAPIVPFPSDNTRREEGAELVFNGRVRGTEQGQDILALEYEHYEGMAEQELQSLADETMAKFLIQDLFCRHRVGRITIGEASLHVAIWSQHRKEGLQAMTYFIRELKERVPIWKWAILVSGERVPSECVHRD
ncbi:MAG TPA: molybdenum cofactor biosynthesis protein MoaE [Candidatus Marinimicrobia bacterium]|nr:molybdenum cofactor biosynthesis protein MoaE [Candidatus Neomarinimicrobiota bacterium]